MWGTMSKILNYNYKTDNNITFHKIKSLSNNDKSVIAIYKQETGYIEISSPKRNYVYGISIKYRLCKNIEKSYANIEEIHKLDKNTKDIIKKKYIKFAHTKFTQRDIKLIMPTISHILLNVEFELKKHIKKNFESNNKLLTWSAILNGIKININNKNAFYTLSNTINKKTVELLLRDLNLHKYSEYILNNSLVVRLEGFLKELIPCMEPESLESKTQTLFMKYKDILFIILGHPAIDATSTITSEFVIQTNVTDKTNRIDILCENTNIKNRVVIELKRSDIALLGSRNNRNNIKSINKKAFESMIQVLHYVNALNTNNDKNNIEWHNTGILILNQNIKNRTNKTLDKTEQYTISFIKKHFPTITLITLSDIRYRVESIIKKIKLV